MTRFRWGVATDVGQVRSVNQDSAFAADGFFVVADGMGGHRGGEVASAVTVDTLAAALPVVSSADVLEAVHAANDAVLARATADPSLRGMGTTLCLLALVADDDAEEPLLALVNVGDSRAYQFAGGTLEQMTDDHSVVGEMVRQGRISASEAEAHPQRNILTRALGIDAGMRPDAWLVRPLPGDRWLLCSDGLFNEVDERTIADVLRAVDDPTVAARHLVQLANEGGGRDNITVLIIDVLADDEHAAAAPVAPVHEGELAGARRRVDAAPPAAGVPAPEQPSGGASRPADPPADTDAPDDREPTAAATAVAAPAPVAHPEPAAPRSRSGRLRAAWRVVAFVGAILVVVAVAAGAWLVLGDDDPAVPPPPPSTTSSTTTTTSTTTTSTTTTTTTSTTTTIAVATAPTTTGP